MGLLKKKKRKPQKKKVVKPTPKAKPKQWIPPFAMAGKCSQQKMFNNTNPIPDIPKLTEAKPSYTIPTPASFPEAVITAEKAERPIRQREQFAKKEFLKTFRKLTYRWRSWDVWTDFVTLVACTISNAVDKLHYEEREATYMRIITKYNKEEQTLFPELFAQLVLALEDNPEQDFLGDIYTELGLNSKEHKQIFTPYHICHLMAELTFGDLVKDVEEKGFITIHDACCGAGATLIAATNLAKVKLGKADLNFQNHILITGQDIDPLVTMMCYIQISLLGVAGYFKVGSTFTEPMADGDSLDDYWFTPMYFFPVWTFRRMWRSLDKLTEGGQVNGDS